MPRIDPQQLLNCLSVLLASNGGIKSTKEVNRLVQLMGKFSKKLVSKCIYVQILKSTETELLGQFMADGGWALSHIWLQDGILTRNWPLVQELLELMLLCPVDVQRLKSNSAPKLVKGLTKDGGNDGVRILASKLVEQWLKIVKEESAVTPVTVEQQEVVVDVLKSEVPEVKEESTESGSDGAPDEPDASEEMVDPLEIPSNHVPVDDADSKERISKAKSDGLVYKITVRDGKQVFAKLEASPKKEMDGEKVKLKGESSPRTKSDDASKAKSEPIAKLKIATVDGKKQIKDKVKTESVEVEKGEAVKKTEKGKSESGKEKSKSDEKERRSSKESGDSKDSKEKRKDSSSKSSSSSSSTKHSGSSSSSSRSSSHKSSRSDSKHKSSSSSSSSSSSRDKNRDSEKDKDRERSSKSSSSKSSSKSSSSSSSSKSKEKRDSTDEKLSQSMKDKDTLTKVIPPSISKLGKIPKKPATADGDNAATDPAPAKKSSISIEVKKDAENRPKTVKTFNSKFRSHGLAEEAPPPPSRRGLQRPSSQPTAGASIPTVTKRSSPPPEKKDVAVPEKKLKIDTALAAAADKPGIKLIPAKPKTPVLVESDMFMDAIFASQTTKKDSARKRKRLPSQSTTETTKPEKVQSPDAKSVAPKFYQDTLDNEPKDDDNKADESKRTDGTDDETTAKAGETAEDAGAADVEMQETADDSAETKDTENVVVENKKPPGPGCGPNGPPGVLTILKRKGPKKQLRWRPQESLEEIHYFELDETERTNVSRNSVEAHQSMNEREGDAFLIARKMNADDQMTEQVPWKPLLIVDDVPPHPEGKESKEKKIQFDREQTCLRAIYFNRFTIPDSPAEPDMEHYQITDPAIIPLDDPNGPPEGIKDLVAYGWPEPRGSPRQQPIGFEDPVPFNSFPPNFGFNNGPGWNNQPNLLPPAFNGPPNLLNMNAMQPPDAVNNMNMNPMNMMPMNQPFPNQNQNFGPPNGMRNNNFNGNNFGNNRMNAGPPQNNQNWFRPNGPPQNNWRPPMGNNNNNGGGGNNNNNRPRHDWNPRNICRAFDKGFCRHGDKCQWLHPGINCPPFN